MEEFYLLTISHAVINGDDELALQYLSKVFDPDNLTLNLFYANMMKIKGLLWQLVYCRLLESQDEVNDDELRACYGEASISLNVSLRIFSVVTS